MTPTSRLRFVDRESYSKNGEHFVKPFKIRVLQQFWMVDGSEPYEEWVKSKEGEWRDVPSESE